MGPKNITVKELTFGYSRQQVLNNLSALFKEKKFTVLLGPNGSGKSTLLKLILRVMEAERGEIFINGSDIQDLSRREVARLVGSVPQNPTITYRFTVYQAVMMGRYPRLGRFENPGKRDTDAVIQALERTDTLHLKEKLITELSGGEFRRVMIARSLAQEPDILALDEPTAFLDLRHQIDLLNLVRGLKRDEGMTVLCVLHDLNLALSYADEIILLNKGAVYNSGTPQEVLSPEALQDVYGIRAELSVNSYTGTPMIIPDYS